jgi:hydroxymethylpyrimidine/phosphomethylpyrimidine kinase
VIRTALSIAGSDPSGGAGIQADLKTFLDHQLYGMAVITGLTAQNTRGVLALEPVRPAFIAEQIAAVLDDMRVDAIKVGMVPSQAAAHAIVRALEGYRGPVVVDPLLFASDDTPIGPGQAGLAALVDRATLVTPNGPECTRLIGDRSPGEWQKPAWRYSEPAATMLALWSTIDCSCPTAPNTLGRIPAFNLEIPTAPGVHCPHPSPLDSAANHRWSKPWPMR